MMDVLSWLLSYMCAYRRQTLRQAALHDCLPKTSASAARPSPTGIRTGPLSQPTQATRCPAARAAREAGTAVTTLSVKWTSYYAL
jgi:hypothetical protein